MTKWSPGRRRTRSDGGGAAAGSGPGRVSRQQALARSAAQIDDGALFATLRRRVALPTESRNPARAETLRRYLDEEIRPELEALGFTCMVREHPAARGPFLLARRDEAAGLPTIFSYGHGDVVGGMDRDWHEGLSPWTLQERSGAWYGRGVVDNKGQHTINMAALGAVLRTRGRLGFNAVYLVEMGEEVGSPGLREVCQENREFLAADVLIASDGPRVSAARPTIYLGARGGMSFDLTIEARSGTHHSGNWGGVLSNPGIQLAHAIATITSPTGQIRIPQWVPAQLPDSVRAALADCTVDGGPDGPAIDPAWGEPGLTPAEQIFGWCSFEVTGVPHRQSRRARECGARVGPGALPASLRGGHRRAGDPARLAPPSRSAGLPDGARRAGG